MIDETARQLGDAFATFTRAALDREPDDLEGPAVAFGAAVKAVLEVLPERERVRLSEAASAAIGTWRYRSPEAEVIADAEYATFTAALHRRADEIDAGERAPVWPPARSAELVDVMAATRVRLARLRSEWPDVIDAETLFGTVYDLIVDTADRFVAAWRHARCRAELLEQFTAADDDRWQRYLELPDPEERHAD